MAWAKCAVRPRFWKRQGSVNLIATSARLLLVKFTASSRRRLLLCDQFVEQQGVSSSMSIKHLTAAVVLASALLLSGPLQARNLPTQASSVIDATEIGRAHV